MKTANRRRLAHLRDMTHSHRDRATDAAEALDLLRFDPTVEEHHRCALRRDRDSAEMDVLRTMETVEREFGCTTPDEVSRLLRGLGS